MARTISFPPQEAHTYAMAAKSTKSPRQASALAAAGLDALQAGRRELGVSFQWTYNHLRHTIVPSSHRRAKAGAIIDGVYDASREAARAFHDSYRGNSDDKHPGA